jgi:hypothetical protein
MTVIAIDGHPSSRRDDVATGVATGLHLTIIEDLLIESHIAERLQVDSASVRSAFECTRLGLNPWRPRRKTALKTAVETVLDLASKGNVVIRGWRAAEILRPVAHVLRVCVGKCPEPLHHPKWLRWNPPGHSERIGVYDIVLTARLSVQSCVEQILGLAPDPEFKETPGSRATLARLLEAARNDAARLGASRSHVFFHFELGRDPLRLPDGMSTDERIACVETHLRGQKRAHPPRPEMIVGDRLI